MAYGKKRRSCSPVCSHQISRRDSDLMRSAVCLLLPPYVISNWRMALRLFPARRAATSLTNSRIACVGNVSATNLAGSS